MIYWVSLHESGTGVEITGEYLHDVVSRIPHKFNSLDPVYVGTDRGDLLLSRIRSPYSSSHPYRWYIHDTLDDVMLVPLIGLDGILDKSIAERLGS